MTQRKVDRVLANHSLSSTASQGTSNIPVSWFLLLGCYRQARTLFSYLSFECLGCLSQEYYCVFNDEARNPLLKCSAEFINGFTDAHTQISLKKRLINT